jgi:hypothetical protein
MRKRGESTEFCELSNLLDPSPLTEYQDFLSDIDVVAAKAICKPHKRNITNYYRERRMYLEMPTIPFCI